MLHCLRLYQACSSPCYPRPRCGNPRPRKAEKQLEKEKTLRLAHYVATRAAASSKSLIVLAEALVRDLDYDHSRFFSDMVPNTSSCFGLPPDVRNRNCPLAYCLIARSCASVEDMVAWDGAYSGEAFEDFGEQFILSYS